MDPRDPRAPGLGGVRGRPETPRLTDAIVGYRAWRVDAYGNLCALTEHYAWSTRVATAACRYSEYHRPPIRASADCGCGLYARFDPAHLAEYDDPDVANAMMPVVMGAVPAPTRTPASSP
jgi:hypothetical protein